MLFVPTPDPLGKTTSDCLALSFAGVETGWEQRYRTEVPLSLTSKPSPGGYTYRLAVSLRQNGIGTFFWRRDAICRRDTIVGLWVPKLGPNLSEECAN